MHPPRFHSLSAKLLAIQLPLVLVAVVTVFTFIEIDFYRTERAQLVNGLRRTVYLQSQAFESALWNFDMAQVKALLAEQSQLPDFKSAAVYDVDGNMVAKIGDTGAPLEAPDFRAESELAHIARGEREIIGKLMMTAHGDNIRNNLFRHLKVNGMTLLALLVALFSGTIFGTRWVVGRPIEVFRRSIEGAEAGGRPEPIAWESRDEIGDVVRAYNAMLDGRAAAEDEARRRTESAQRARRDAEAAKSELQEKLEEIERFNRLAVGREGRIIELKAEINDLSRAAGRPEPFSAPSQTKEDGEAAAVPLAEDIEGTIELTDFIDLNQLQSLLVDFCDAVGIASAIIDPDGKVLAAARWQRACTGFHRVNEDTRARCIESDTELALHLQDGKEFTIYRCNNGLTDAASPIVINGRHLANVFIGQFLLQAPDEAFFRRQARDTGFDEAEYLKAIAEVPIIDEGRLPAILGFLVRFANLVASMSMERAKAEKAGVLMSQERVAAMNLAEDAEKARADLAEYQKHLERLVEERTADLAAAEERSRLILDSAGEGIFGTDAEGKVMFVNPAGVKMLGFAAEELIGKKIHPIVHHSRTDGSAYPLEECPMWRAYTQGETGHVEDEVLWRKDGTSFDIEYSAMPIVKGGALAGSVVTFRDITERKALNSRLILDRAMMRSVFDSIPDLIYVKNPHGVYLSCNIAFASLLGRAPQEIVAHSDYDLFPKDVADQFIDNDRGVLAAGEGRGNEEWVDYPDGRKVLLDTLKIPFWDTEGSLLGLVGVSRDITDRKLAEKALADERARLQEILDKSPISIAFSTKGRIHFANPMFIETFGAKPGDLSPNLYVHPEDRDAVVERLNREGIVRNNEIRMYDKEKRERDMLITYLPITFEGEKGILGWLMDITERKEAEEALRGSQQQIRTLVDSIRSVIFMKDFEGRHLLVNSFYEAATGISQREILGKTDRDVMPSDIALAIMEQDRHVMDSREPLTYEETVPGRDGVVRHYLTTKVPLINDRGEVHGMCGVATDITERKKAEALIEERTSRLQSIIDTAVDGVIVISETGIVESFSPSAVDIFGYAADEVIGQNVCLLMPADIAAEHDSHLRRYMAGGPSRVVGTSTEVNGRRKDGSIFPMEIAIGEAFLGEERIFTGIVRDITERKEAQAKLAEAYDIIAGSIEYASRIQRSLLPDASNFSTLVTDSFVLWEPRDRVGGDAYWCAHWGRGGLLALGDCTGHGVPGAFMTIIANGALEMALLETPPGDPAALLQRTHQLIQSELNQDQEVGESDDGMELGVCHLAPRSNKLVFAGARFSLFFVDGDTVTEVRGDKSGLGYRGIPRNAAFTNHDVDLAPGRAFYLTSDGLIDQVGGAKRRGFGKKRFQELLCEVAALPMAEQRSHITRALAEHQGNERRRDDVTVIGFRLNGGR